jgi:hypothetical protein
MPSLNPIKYFRFISRIIKYGSKVKRKTDLSLLKQGVEVYKLFRLNLLEPKEYYDYELFDPRLSWDDKKRFLSRNQFAMMHRELNPPKDMGTTNKLVFKFYAQFFNLPIPKMYGLFDPNFGFDPERNELRTLKQLEKLIARPEITEFMLKAIGADKGRGSMLCLKKDDSTLHAIGIGDLTIPQLYERMVGTHHNQHKFVTDSWLIEERVHQHPFFDNYTDSCTQTIRVIAFATQTGEIEIIAAGLNVAGKGRPNDNVGEDGMAARVDENGILGPAVQRTPEGLKYFDEHPETGYPITGQQLPKFDEALKLAIRAQSVVPHMRILGWDIAITADGPVILEANAHWNWETMQRISRRGLIRKSLATEIRKIMAGT